MVNMWMWQRSTRNIQKNTNPQASLLCGSYAASSSGNSDVVSSSKQLKCNTHTIDSSSSSCSNLDEESLDTSIFHRSHLFGEHVAEWLACVRKLKHSVRWVKYSLIHQPSLQLQVGMRSFAHCLLRTRCQQLQPWAMWGKRQEHHKGNPLQLTCLQWSSQWTKPPFPPQLQLSLVARFRVTGWRKSLLYTGGCSMMMSTTLCIESYVANIAQIKRRGQLSLLLAHQPSRMKLLSTTTRLPCTWIPLKIWRNQSQGSLRLLFWTWVLSWLTTWEYCSTSPIT